MEISAQLGEVDANEWELRHDETSGQPYYVNLRTGESSWEAPGVTANPSNSAVTVHPQWSEARDETGRTYFVNLQTMETSWDPPLGFYSTVAHGSAADPLVGRPSTAEEMEQLNALLSGGDGDDGEDGELPSDAASSTIPADDVAVTAPLTDGSEWMMFLNETDGIPYYYNHLSGECVWEPPAAFLEYHLQHNTDQESGPPSSEQELHWEAAEQRSVATPSPNPPASPPPPSPKALAPVPLTPEFEEKVRRAIETVSKTPVGSSRLLFVRTPTVKSIEGVSSGRSSRPSSSSGRPASRPGSSTGSARQRALNASVSTESEQNPVVNDVVELRGAESIVNNRIDVRATEEASPETLSVDMHSAPAQETSELEANEEPDMELQQHDAMMQELLFDETALVIQCFIRCFLARRKVARKREEQATTRHLSSGEVIHEPQEDGHEDAEGLRCPELEGQDPEPNERGHSDGIDGVGTPDVSLEMRVTAQGDIPSVEETGLHEGVEEKIIEGGILVHEEISEDPNSSEVSLLEFPSTAIDDRPAVAFEERDGALSVRDEPVVPAIEEPDSSTEEPTIAPSELEAQQTPRDPDRPIVSEKLSELVVEVDLPDATTDTPSDHAGSQPEQDVEKVEAEQHAANMENVELPPESSQIESVDVSTLPSFTATSTPGVVEDLVAVAESTESVEENVRGIPETTADEVTAPESTEIDESNFHPTESNQTQDDTCVAIGDELVNQHDLLSADDPVTNALSVATQRLPCEEIPVENSKSTQRNVDQAAIPLVQGDQVYGAPARELPKPVVDLSKNRLAVLDVSSFFPVSAPRRPRAQVQGTKPAANKHPADGSIVRKAVPSQPSIQSKSTKTKEQREQERRALAESAEKARQGDNINWKQEAAQYQQIYADAATRHAVDTKRVVEEEALRAQGAVVENQERMRTVTAEESSSTMVTGSVWEVAGRWKTDSSILEQFKSMVKTASEPHGFTLMMMHERLRAVKSNVVRLQHSDEAKAVYWQERVSSFPASADEILSCKDAYWTRLYSNLRRLAEFSSPETLAQHFSKHRTDSLDSLLHLAAWHGNTVIVASLVSEFGFDVNALDNSVSRTTPLHEACRGGHVDVVESLLNHGAFLDAIDAHGETPLHVASRLGHSLVVHRLLAVGETHHDREDSECCAHPPHLQSLAWPQCVHWRNLKGQRAVDIATLPSLKEFLTQYSSECLPETDVPKTNEPHSRGVSATSATAKASKVVLKKKKIKSARPRSAAKSSSTMSMGTAAAALAVHAR